MKNQTISEDIAPRRCGIAVWSVMLQRLLSVELGVLRVILRVMLRVMLRWADWEE